MIPQKSDLPNEKVIDYLRFMEKRKQVIPPSYKYDSYNKNIQSIEEIKQILEIMQQNFLEEIQENNEETGIKPGIINSNIGIDECLACKEMTEMKINHSMPKFTLVYIIGSSIVLGFLLTCLYLSVFMEIHIMHPIKSVLFFIGFLGLLITALTSIKEWRTFVKNAE